MIVCDVTQFYSPFGGGVRRYLTEKRRYVQDHTEDEHVLIIPGPENRYERDGRLHTYFIKSPPISRTSRYRALLNQKEVRRILLHVRPDVIESGDPYQVAWTALEAAGVLGVPTVGFYHSHFPDAYLRTAAKFGGPLVREAVLALARRYVKRLYNRFDYTFVCAERLRGVLRDWGVESVCPVKLGVDTQSFSPGMADPRLRLRLGLNEDSILLLYVGRLAGEKNVQTLFSAFERLRRHSWIDYRLLCIGQGPWREQLQETSLATNGAAMWIPNITDSRELARYYRTADLAVHPSINETFGLVPLEEQACGLPVCGIRGSCLDENIMAGLQYWADTNRPAHLAAAIQRMTRADRPVLGKIASKEVRERYAWPVVLGEIWERYRELARNKSRRHPRPLKASVPTPRIGIRKFQSQDRAAVRRICCETGFLGSPIDAIFEDRETFADLLTSYYTDVEPESLLILLCGGEVCGYLCGCRHPRRLKLHLATLIPRLGLRVFGRYLRGRYNSASRRYVRWLLLRGLRETPPHPADTPHFHVNVLPSARSIPGTKTLIDEFLSYLESCGDTGVYGQMVVFSDRRGEALFRRFGFQVLNRREITKFRDVYRGRVFLCTAFKELSPRAVPVAETLFRESTA
jgi:alpha-1,6-mannosyltransferase